MTTCGMTGGAAGDLKDLSRRKRFKSARRNPQMAHREQYGNSRAAPRFALVRHVRTTTDKGEQRYAQ